MEKNGKQYVCTPYQPFGGGLLPTPYGAALSAAAPSGAADTFPLRVQDGSLPGLPAPAPEGAPADPTALTSIARQYVTSFRAQQPAQGPAAAQAPAADPLFANLFAGQLFCIVLCYLLRRPQELGADQLMSYQAHLLICHPMRSMQHGLGQAPSGWCWLQQHAGDENTLVIMCIEEPVYTCR